MSVDQTSLDRIRNATFPSARRGYDKHEVEKFLGRLADWLETGGGDESRSDAVKRELEKVGQRTGAILSQAEESAQQIRAEAEEDARGTINSANIEAGEARSEAENYAVETKASAEREAREAIEAAQAQARRIIAEAEQRREDTEELAGKLSAAAEQHRSDDLRALEALAAPEESPEDETDETRAADPTYVAELEAPDEEMSAEPEGSEEAPAEPEGPDEVPAEPEGERDPQDTQEHAITTERDSP